MKKKIFEYFDNSIEVNKAVVDGLLDEIIAKTTEEAYADGYDEGYDSGFEDGHTYEGEPEEPEATPVAADRISQYNTTVDGVTLTTPEDGKATFSFGEEVTWPSDQEPNVDLGADPDTVYVDLLVTAPEGATKVLIGEEIVPLDDLINGTLPTGRLHYFPVAQKSGETIVGFSEAKTWELTYKWYNDSDQVIAVETLEVTREAYVVEPEEPEDPIEE